MKKVVVLILSVMASLCLPAKVNTFKYAAQVEKSQNYTVEVNGKVQTVLATSEPDVCIFDCDRPVTVKVRSAKPSSRADVRPLSLDFNSRYENGEVTLTLKPKDRVVVEFDGDYKKPLFIFANQAGRKPAGDNVRVLKAGRTYEYRDLKLANGETLYLEGGAVLYGNIKTKRADNVTVCGSGVIDSRDFDSRAMSFIGCHNLSISGVTVINSRGWCTYLAECSDIDIDNYKVVAEFNPNVRRGVENDALDFISSSHARVRHGLSYCHDDALCVKTAVYKHHGKAEDISFEDCVVWNVTGGNSMEIGYAVNEDINNISFKNIYSIHSRDNVRHGARNSDISIHCAGRGKVTNISYENIYLEESDNYLFNFAIFNNGNCESFYGYQYTPGAISNVSVKNVYVLYDQVLGSQFFGYDEANPVQNVTIDGLYFKGVRAKDISECMFDQRNTSGIILK